MAPRHEYDLRVSALTHSYEVADYVKPFRAKLESDELIVPHEKGDVTLEKLKDFVFVDEGDDEDPEFVESSGESEDSLEYESEHETPCREYDLRVPSVSSYDVDDLKPVTVRLEWEQLIVPHEEGDVTLDKLNEFVFEDEDVEEDPEYEESIVETEDSLEYDSEYDIPCHDYDLRAPTIGTYDVDDLTPVTLELEGGQLIVPHEEGAITLDNLEGCIFEDDDDEEDPEYEESIVDTEDSLEYESDEFEEDVEDASQDALASVVTSSCFNLVENEDVNWSFSNKAEEYVASFGVSQLGIRLVDSGLSAIETPVSYFSTWMSDGVRHTRRHLRAARRAGEKQNSDSCRARSLLVQMATLFPLSAVLGSMGVALVESTLCESHMADENIDDPSYVPSSDETEDSLEFRSEIESEEDLVSDLVSESILSSDWEEIRSSEEETDSVASSGEDTDSVASSEYDQVASE